MNASETDSTENPYFNTRDLDSPNTPFSGPGSQNEPKASPRGNFSGSRENGDAKYTAQNGFSPSYDQNFDSLLTYNSSMNNYNNNQNSINNILSQSKNYTPNNQVDADFEKELSLNVNNPDIDFSGMDNMTAEANFEPVQLTNSLSNFNTMSNGNNSDLMSLGANNNDSNNFTMNNIDGVFSANDMLLNESSYQSPRQLSTSFNKNDVQSKIDTFSPESFGFSSNIGNNPLTKTISNNLARSYGSHLGSSLNNLISPSSTYDGYVESPYGSFNDDSLKSPMNSPNFKGLASPSSSHVNSKSALSKESKLSRRRELHNAVERRRRDLIKEKIKELGTLIPPTLLYDNVKFKNTNKEIKANKNIILNKTVDYIQFLQEILSAQEKRLDELQGEIEKLDLNDSDIYSTNGSFSKNISGSGSNQLSNAENIQSNHETSEGFDAGSNSISNGYVSKENEEQMNYYNDSVKPSEDETYSTYNKFITNASDYNTNNAQYEKIQNSLSAFTDNIDIKSHNSKLNFMDLSNTKSEPMDFRKLSESLNNANNGSNDNMEAFLTFNPDQDTRYESQNGDENNNNDDEKDNSFVPGEFPDVLQTPVLKFSNDADFLDQLLSKEPGSNGFGM